MFESRAGGRYYDRAAGGITCDWGRMVVRSRRRPLVGVGVGRIGDGGQHDVPDRVGNGTGWVGARHTRAATVAAALSHACQE